MPTKTKMNYSAENKLQKDLCQTPPYALGPLLPYLRKFIYIWEPASGEGFDGE